jgi:DNA polymerase III delta prime subunit
LIPKLLISEDPEEIQHFINVQVAKFALSPFSITSLGLENSSIKIEQIRELKQSLNLKNASGKIKLIIFYNAENLTTESQNACLKILEEPPENTLILLCTPNENLLLPTIISRCEIIRLNSKFKFLPQGDLPQVKSSKQIQNSNIKNQNDDKKLKIDVVIRKNPLEISENPNTTTIENIKKMDIGEKFAMVENLCKKEDKDEKLENIRKRVIDWINFLLQQTPKQQNNHLFLKSLVIAKNQIQKNLNLKLVLENFLINC